jgi:hypothetical protein
MARVFCSGGQRLRQWLIVFYVLATPKAWILVVKSSWSTFA